MTIVFGNAQVSSGATPEVVNKPTGTVDGDLLFLVGSNANGGAMTAPAGWTLLESPTFAAYSTCHLWTRIAASEPAAYQVSGTAGDISAAALRYSGQNISSIRDSAAIASGVPSTTSPVPALLVGTQATDVSLICYGWGANDQAVSPGFPASVSGWTTRVNTFSAGASFRSGLYIIEKLNGTDRPTISAANGGWAISSVSIADGVSGPPIGSLMPFFTE